MDLNLRENKVIYSELGPRRKIPATSIAQLIFSVLCLIMTGYLIYHNDCPAFQNWAYVLFFGSLIWLVYLLVTLVVKFNNVGTRMMVEAVDWVFLAFHLAMMFWAHFKYWKGTNSCSPKWNFWVLIYLIFGYFIAFSVLASLVMNFLRSFNKNSHILEHPEYNHVQHLKDYDPAFGDNDSGYFF